MNAVKGLDLKRRMLLGLAVLAGLGAAGYGLFVSLQTCGALDRLLRISGCAQVTRIVNFQPLPSAAISAPDEKGEVSLFGHIYEGGTSRPALVRLELGTGEELARIPLPVGEGFGQLIFAQDGQKAVLTCITAQACFEDGNNGAIVSVADGKILETHRQRDEDHVYFPGDPRPAVGDGWVQLFAAGGERILSVERDGAAVLMAKDGTQVASLRDGPRNDILRSGVSVSPSGARIALFDYALGARSARLQVWDALSGRQLVDRDLGPLYRWRFTPTWTQDETQLTLIRRRDRDTLLELHRLQ